MKLRYAMLAASAAVALSTGAMADDLTAVSGKANDLMAGPACGKFTIDGYREGMPLEDRKVAVAKADEWIFNLVSLLTAAGKPSNVYIVGTVACNPDTLGVPDEFPRVVIGGGKF